MPTRLQGLVTLAEVRLRAGDPVAAKRLLDQTEPLAEQAGGERALAQWHLQLARGLALQAAGNDIEALVAMKRICAVAPLDSAWFQLPRLNCVRSLVLSQEKTSAIRLLQEAMPALIRDLGDDAPNTQRARRLLEALQSPAGWRPPPWNGGQIFVAF
jgi:ATP/maltotriose-dependent transcriptional regulator MalT